jgi:hypothetical protein
VTLYVRTARLPNVPPDAVRVTRAGSWLTPLGQLPRCYLELRMPKREGGKRPVDSVEEVRKWRASCRSFLRTLSTTHREQWHELLGRKSVTLVCCCRSAPCVRFLIQDYLAEHGALAEKEFLG